MASWRRSWKKESDLKTRLTAGFVHDWQTDQFARGAYSYGNVGGANAGQLLAEPIADTLFFAGEATNAEGHNGTVNGAINSGISSGATNDSASRTTDLE